MSDTPEIDAIIAKTQGEIDKIFKGTRPILATPDALADALQAALDENERLREALAFYADKPSTGYDVYITDYGLSTDVGAIIKDAGFIARAALSGDHT